MPSLDIKSRHFLGVYVLQSEFHILPCSKLAISNNLLFNHNHLNSLKLLFQVVSLVGIYPNRASHINKIIHK